MFTFVSFCSRDDVRFMKPGAVFLIHLGSAGSGKSLDPQRCFVSHFEGVNGARGSKRKRIPGWADLGWR